MRTGTGSETTGLKWLLDDHASTALSTGLGSTAITADGATGSKLSELHYKPWGEIRYVYQPTTTGLRYTGQRMEGIGLYDYGARWFDAYLNRWIQPDDIIPDPYNSQDWDRYAYVRNNPVKFVDPTGHMLDQGGGGGAFSMGEEWWENRQKKLDFLNKKEKGDKPSFIDLNKSSEENNNNQCLNGNTCISPWDLPSSWDMDPTHPDYYILSISYGEGFGVTATFTWDRFGNAYVGIGPNIGKSLTPLTVSLNGGFIGSASDKSIPDQGNISSFLAGIAVNGEIGSVGDIAGTWSPFAGKYIPNTSIEYGGVLPASAGISITYSKQIVPWR